ncbi:hypothetical protein C1M53_09070 [Mesorhizobium sp. Pch-S]|nr:hypothetical protein C1M53_09070 [Mesorhizobium sp. Pch-S]
MGVKRPAPKGASSSTLRRLCSFGSVQQCHQEHAPGRLQGKTVLVNAKLEGNVTHPQEQILLAPATLPAPAGYSHIAIVPAKANLAFISGQVPLNSDGELIGGQNFEEQAIQVFRNIGAALEAIGSDFRHVVKFGMFVTDMANLPTLRSVRDRFIVGEAPPTSTLVEVSRFFRPDILVEIEAIALCPGAR